MSTYLEAGRLTFSQIGEGAHPRKRLVPLTAYVNLLGAGRRGARPEHTTLGIYTRTVTP